MRKRVNYLGSSITMPDDDNNIAALVEAAPDSLDLLFQRFDQHLGARTFATEAGQAIVMAMIEEYRRLRAEWAAAEASGARRAPSARKKASAAETLAALGLASDTSDTGC